jgi:hypothetical protein
MIETLRTYSKGFLENETIEELPPLAFTVFFGRKEGGYPNI